MRKRSKWLVKDPEIYKVSANRQLLYFNNMLSLHYFQCLIPTVLNDPSFISNLVVWRHKENHAFQQQAQVEQLVALCSAHLHLQQKGKTQGGTG